MNGLSEEEFDLLCTLNDKILFERKEDYNRLSISILHVIREHPMFLKKFIPVFRYNKLKFNLYLIYKLGINFLKLLIWLGKSFFILDRSKDLTNHKKINGIIISHFLNKSFLHHKSDFYFDYLGTNLSDTSNYFSTFYINYSSLSRRKLNKQQRKFILPKYSSLNVELKISFGLIKEGFKLWLSSVRCNGLENRLRKLSAIDSIGSTSHFSLRLEHQIQSLINKLKPKFIITTLEGHPWEKVLFYSLKKFNKNVISIGYQHALIFKKQHSLLRKFSQNTTPDFIFTSGSYGRDVLIKNKILKPEKIFELGSPRITSNKKHENFRPDLKTALFLPEGDYNECFLMFEFMYRLANQNKDWKFIIRFHPLISSKKLHIKLFFKPPKFKNIEISNVPLNEDFERSNYAVFRGTTTIIKAIQYGLYPIYLKQKNEMSINPFWKNNHHIDEIENPKDFEKIILSSFNEKQLKIKKANKLINNYFSPINYQIAKDLKNILQNS